MGFVTAMLAPHEMRLKSSRPMAARLDCIDLGEAQIVDLQYGTDVWIDPAVIEDNYMIHTAISGSSQLWDGGQHSTIEPGALHVTSPGARLRVNMTYRCRHLTVRLSKPAFNGYLSRELGVSVGRPLAFDAAGVHARVHVLQPDGRGLHEGGRVEGGDDALRQRGLVFVHHGDGSTVQAVWGGLGGGVERARESPDDEEQQQAVAPQAAQFLEPELPDVADGGEQVVHVSC